MVGRTEASWAASPWAGGAGGTFGRLDEAGPAEAGRRVRWLSGQSHLRRARAGWCDGPAVIGRRVLSTAWRGSARWAGSVLSPGRRVWRFVVAGPVDGAPGLAGCGGWVLSTGDGRRDGRARSRPGPSAGGRVPVDLPGPRADGRVPVDLPGQGQLGGGQPVRALARPADQRLAARPRLAGAGEGWSAGGAATGPDAKRPPHPNPGRRPIEERRPWARRPAGRAPRCRTRGAAAWTSPAPRSGGCAHA